MAKELGEDGGRELGEGAGESHDDELDDFVPNVIDTDLEDEDEDDGEDGADDGGDDDDQGPPAWFDKMVEEEGEEAAQAYAEFLASKQGKKVDDDGAGAGAGDDGGQKATVGDKQGGYDQADETWNYQQTISTSQARYAQLTQQANTIADDYKKAQTDLQGIEDTLADTEGMDEGVLKQLRAAQTNIKTQLTRLSQQWGPMNKELDDLTLDLHIAQKVENDAQILPEIAANKPVYAKLIKDGKIKQGSTRAEIIGLINAELAQRGGGKGNRKSSNAWKKVQAKLGKAPKKVGGGKAGSGGKGGGGSVSRNYDGFSPSVAAMLRRADTQHAALRGKKGGKK